MPCLSTQIYAKNYMPTAMRLWRYVALTLLTLMTATQGFAQTAGSNDWLTPQQEAQMDASRPIIWEKDISKDDFKDFVYLPGGGMIAVGTTSSDPDEQSFIVFSRYDDQGGLLWRKTVENHGRSWLVDIEPARNGDYYVAGAAEITKTQNHGYVARINSSGTVIWEQILTPGDGTRASFAKTTPDGGVIVGGSVYTKFVEKEHYDPAIHKNIAAAKIAHRYMTPYLEKLDSNGNTEWTKTIILKDDATFNRVRSLVLTADGGYILLAHSRDIKKSEDYSSLAKVDTDGQTIWLQKLPNFDYIRQSSMAVLTGGNIAIAGNVEEELKKGGNAKLSNRGRVFVYDSTGTLLQTTKFPKHHIHANIITPVSDGHFYMAGGRSSQHGWRVYLAKFKNNGDIVWDKPYSYKTHDKQAKTVSPMPSGDIMLLMGGPAKAGSGANTDHFMRVSQHSDIADSDYAGLRQKRRLNSSYSVLKASAPKFSSSRAINTLCRITIDLDETGTPYNARIKSCDVKKKIQKACLKAALKYQYRPAYKDGKPIGVKDVEIGMQLVIW